MTHPVEELQASAPVSREPARGASAAVGAVCPFLVAADGDWRSVHATREHRCGATRPPVAPALAKQRDLCLQPAHERCATFLAAVDIRESARPPGVRADGLWPDAGAALLALEPARGRGPLGGASTRGGQALLVGMMVLAFLVLVIARTTPPSSGGAPTTIPGAGVASAPPAGEPSPSPTSPSTSSPEPTRAPTPPPSVTPAPTPRPTASPAAPATHKVRSGDTLSSIATRYGTTVKKLKAANDLTGNTIRPGQVLVIP